MKFKELNISDNLLEGIGFFNYSELTDIQEKVIPVILENKDLLACSQTGSGKTAAFLIPLIEMINNNPNKSLEAIIICPTRELCLQIEEQITGLAYLTGVSSCPVYGGGDSPDFEVQKKSISSGNTNIIVATPGRLLSHLKLGYSNLENVKHLILDEADEMLDMGFYTDIINIIEHLPKKRQNLLFSATMPGEIKKLAEKILVNPVIVDLNKSKPAELIQQNKFFVNRNEKFNLLKHIIKTNKDKRIIVFAATKSNAIELNRSLKNNNINSKVINSSFTQKERTETIQEFKNKKIHVLVATNLLARGIDITDVGIIMNYDIPDNPDDYVHRIGRTARAGKSGVAISLVSKNEVVYFQRIERHIKRIVPVKELPEGFSKSDFGYIELPTSNKKHYSKNKSNKSKNKKSYQGKNQQKTTQNKFSKGKKKFGNNRRQKPDR